MTCIARFPGISLAGHEVQIREQDRQQTAHVAPAVSRHVDFQNLHALILGA